MNNIIKRVWNQNRMVNIEDLSGAAFQAEDGGHTFQISGIDDTGATVALSGTVAGVFRRPDNADIALTGSASGGVASVTLTDDCYAVPGRFGLTIYTTADGQKTAVYAAVGTVAATNGGAVAGDTPQDVVDLINAIEAAVATIPADYTDLMASIAPMYSNSALYAVGSYAWYDGDLYRCTTPITTAETWTAAHWTAAVISKDVQENDARLSAICNVLPEIDSITINGVTLTNIGGGKYTLVGTSTADTNFTFYTNANDVPNWLSRSKEYYAILQGANSIYCRLVVAKRPSYEFLARTRDKLVAFTVPETGGIMISINIDGNNTFNEIVTPVIVEKGYFTELYFLPKVQENDARLSAICNVLPEIPSTTVNGIELTNIGNGQYTITGTATADTNITFFTSASDVPDFLERGGKYSATLQGAKVTRFIITTRPGYAFLATAKNYLAQFEVPSDGGMMIALNLDGGATYDETITPIIVRDGYFPQLYLPKKTIVVSNNVAEGDFGKIRDAVNYAKKHKGTTIIIKEGSYDLVSEFGQSYLDGLSDSNPDYGIDLGNEVKIICSPRANIYFDYDGTNEWVVRYFSPFNTLNSSYEVVGMHIIAHNCRYVVHDDPRWPDKTNFSHNVWRECYFEIFPSPQVESWVNHQIIGGGFGTNTLIEFDACIFNAHYSGVERYSSLSYHNDVSGWSGSRSFLAIKNCYFANGNRVIIQGYGNSTEKSQVIIAGNSFEDVTTDILYMSSDADNIDVYQYNNSSRY